MNAPVASRCLVVDDDPQMLRLAERLLQGVHSGDVVACDHPFGAIQAFLSAPEGVRLVVTDLELPGVDGLELARRLRLLAPELPVLLMTGSGRSAEELAAGGVRHVLRKPFTRAQFVAAVGEALLDAEAVQAG